MKANMCPIGGALPVFMLLLVCSRQAVANSEGDALGAFKQALADPYGVLESWDTGLVNPCTWLHVTCNNDNSIIRIDLAQASLRGSLVPELAKLRNLQYLELNNNFLSGPIPLELGELSELVSLDLYDNYFTGRIPESLGRLCKLKYLRLNNNMLSGKIPESLTELSNLQVLDLSDNHLSGRVPDGGAFSRMSSGSFEGNDGLCGSNVGKACS